MVGAGAHAHAADTPSSLDAAWQVVEGLRRLEAELNAGADDPLLAHLPTPTT